MRGGLLHARLEPLDLGRGLALEGIDDLEQLPVPGSLRGLADHGPCNVAEVRHHVQVLQVAQQAEAAAAGLVEEVVVEALWLLVSLLSIALHEGLKLLRMGVALLGQSVADVVDVDFGRVGVGYLAKLLSEVQL